MLKRVRVGAAAAGVAAALVITGCSSDSGDGGGKAAKSPEASSSAPTEGSASKSVNLEGSWVAKAGSKSIALLVTGKKAALVGEHVCSGTVGEEAGTRVLALKCPDGNTDRNTGKVTSVDATTLTVSWGAVTDTFRKAENGKLPSGFPTMGLPTS
ncbi:hypothetical protein [Streptomyces sp. NPDC046821]|uniref:hypothetical protein n=1 Tax=Streptomyces sp. NPDC046821 TaxID=3154702 RepID=UPI00340A1301